MQRFRVTSEQAFRMLVSSSQNTTSNWSRSQRRLTETGVTSLDDLSGGLPRRDKPTG